MLVPIKTEKELNTLKEKIESLSRKLQSLSDEELKQVFGGYDLNCTVPPSFYKFYHGYQEELKDASESPADKLLRDYLGLK